MTKIKRNQVLTYIDVNPPTEDYELLSDGIADASIGYNPKVSEQVFIGDSSASIAVESYAPKMPVSGIAVEGDAVFDFIDGLRKTRATLADAETTIVNVWAYDGVSPNFAAEQQTVSISIEEFGGPGGESAKIAYTINYIGAPVAGTFNITTKAFT